MANNDLRNLRILHRLDIPELYLLNTAIIDYKGILFLRKNKSNWIKGQRILAQTIIPGLLSSEHSQRADFGSVDEGKTIHCSPEVNIIIV